MLPSLTHLVSLESIHFYQSGVGTWGDSVIKELDVRVSLIWVSCEVRASIRADMGVSGIAGASLGS